jgi:hypothetical protein
MAVDGIAARDLNIQDLFPFKHSVHRTEKDFLICAPEASPLTRALQALVISCRLPFTLGSTLTRSRSINSPAWNFVSSELCFVPFATGSHVDGRQRDGMESESSLA